MLQGLKTMERSNGECGMTERLAKATNNDAYKVDDDRIEKDQRSIDLIEFVNTVVTDTQTGEKDDSDQLKEDPMMARIEM